jgi:hypothetical protein
MTPGARIVTVSPAKWNRHHQRVIAKRDAPAVTPPSVSENTDSETRAMRMLLGLMRCRMKAQLTEERLFRHIEERYMKKKEQAPAKG